MLNSPQTKNLMIDQTPRIGHFLFLLLLAFVWGSSFILMKRALFTADGSLLFSPYHVGAMRIFFAGVILAPFALRRLLKLPLSAIPWLLAVGILGNTIPAFLFSTAQLRLPSSMAGMLNALTPLFTLIVATLLFKKRYQRIQLIGLLVGFIGAIGLIRLRSDGGETHLPSALMIVAATIMYAFSVNIIRNKLSQVSPIVIAAGALGMMAIPCGIYLAFSDVFLISASRPDAATGLLATAVLGMVGTASALIIFNRIIQETSALFASSVTYVIPVFAAMWGYFDGERLSIWHLVMALIILSGVYLVNSSRNKL
jgi:drug/metabolite transporter (DMT)-like permease